MKINKLVLNSFGKFQNKTIELEDGVNIVIGDNESGKTTVHRFIQGMYFGFYKSNLKTKKNSELYEKYLPWDNKTEYFGGVVFEDDDKEYRIERNFLNGCDDVNVYDNVTGENLTDQYEYNSSVKMVMPGDKHFMMNQDAYENTVSVSQMNSVTSDELINEIKENLLNISETQTLNVSVKNAIKNITDKKSKIGSERSKKSPYGKLYGKITDLNLKKDELAGGYKNLRLLQEEEQKLQLELKSLEDNKVLIEKQMKSFNKNERSEKYEQAVILQKEIDEIQEKHDGLLLYKEISREVVDENLTNYKHKEVLEGKISQSQNNCDELADQIQEINKTLNEIEDTSEIRTKRMLSKIEGYEDKNDEELLEYIVKDIYKYDGLESSKVYIQQGFSEAELNGKENSLKSNDKFRKTQGIGGVISLLVSALLLLLLIIERLPYTKKYVFEPFNVFKSVLTPFHNLLLIVFILLVIMTVVFIVRYIMEIRHRNELTNSIDELISNRNIVNMRLSETDVKQLSLLRKYEVDAYEELVDLQKNFSKEKSELDSRETKKNQLKTNLNMLEAKFNSATKELEKSSLELEGLVKTIKSINERYDVNSEEELKKALEFNYEYKQILLQLNDKKDMLVQITKGQPIESLIVADGDIVENVTKSYEAYEKDLEEILNQIISTNKVLSNLQAEIGNIEAIYNQQMLVEEELAAVKSDLEQKKFELDTLNLIGDTIESIAGRIQNNFAPQLNEQLSKIVSIATDYKYTEVKVNPNMEMSVIDNDTNKIVSVSSLSAGTIDLMYFALRMTLTDIVTKGKKIPIFLDDAFVQYDDIRFKNILTILNKFERQIIIFTCHKREKKISGRVIDEVNIVRI